SLRTLPSTCRAISTTPASSGPSGSVTRPVLRILVKSDTSAPPVLALELTQHVLRACQLVAEDAPCDREEIADQGIAQGVSDGDALLPRGHDVIRAQHREVLRDAGLIQAHGALELLHRPGALHEELDQPDPDRMRERLEESRLERLEIADRSRIGRHLHRI